MKKITLCFMVMVCLGATVFAQSNTLSGSQLALRNNIQSFLKTEGFQPTIDDDGDIKFKRQGYNYYVKIYPADDDPMFVQFSIYFNYSDDITRTKIILFNSEHNYKMCKVFPANEYYVIRSELYLTKSSSFTDIFYKILSVMDGLRDEIKKL